MKPVILIVDDEKNTRKGLAQSLRKPGRKILLAANAYQAEEILEREAVDLVLSDLKMPGMTGLELLKKTATIAPAAAFIIMTAYGTVDTAVKAMKEGAYDYLTKPINLDKLEILVDRALKEKHLARENTYLRQQLQKRYGLENLIGNSRAMEEVFDIIRQIHDSSCTVLISGESGTGKEVVARAIHQQSSRKNQPFVAIHCAALAPTLLESELFGHEKGAFTGAFKTKKGRFEIADGGTVFLDEISEIPPEIQVKLLRFLEMREFERVGGTAPIRVDIRLLAATNADLEKLVKEGKFREDLYYRLNVVQINLPPLRDRREDIPLLARHFLEELSRENRKEITSIAPPVMEILQSHDWPGNIRELKNAIESMVVLARGPVLEESDLSPTLRKKGKSPLPASTPLNMKTMGKELVKKALLRSGNNKTEAAKLLGISRRTLYRKLKEYGIERSSK